MSGLVEKVREKVRGRSRSRSRSRRSIDQDVSTRADELKDMQNSSVRTSQNTDQTTIPRMSSPTIPAWHVHKGARTSLEENTRDSDPQVDPRFGNDVPPVPVVPSSQLSEQRNSHRYTASRDSDVLPPNSPSTQNPMQTGERNSLPYPHTVPRRKESLPQNRANRTSRHRNEKSLDLTMPGEQVDTRNRQSTEATTTTLPISPTGDDLGKEIDQALASLTVDDRAYQENIESHHIQRKKLPESAEHLRLPAGFDLGQTERTVIDTQWKPAVTQENIHRERHEIIREAITRDIHIHHYYTYIQPIRVVEVLPTKHYKIDERTGIKVEIQAPPGWEMPPDLQPRKPDMSKISGWSRHYLVDRDYPNGIPEQPPTSQQDRNYRSSQHNGYDARMR